MNTERTGHSRHIRNILKARRVELGLSAQRVANLIAAELDLTSLTSQAIYTWERFERHPAIDRMAAWARVLGLRLVVDLDDGQSPRKMVLVRTPEAADAARAVDAIEDDERREALAATIRALAKQ